MKICLNDTKLVVCDIDGTLTRDKTIVPSAYTKDIIEKLHQKGIAFGLASGRDVEQLRSLKEEWDLSFDFDLIIGLNGSEYYDLSRDQKKVLCMLSREDIREIIGKMLDRFPDLNCSIYRNGFRLLRYEDPMAIESKKRTKMDNRIVKSLDEMWSEPCTKVMFRVSEAVMKQIEPYAEQISNDRYRCCKTQLTMMEFVHAQSDKGNALRIYCQENGIDLKDVVAFGDMSNDNGLLKTAGTGVCMINGGEDTKKCASVITERSNNEDGCAAFIERYILDQ